MLPDAFVERPSTRRLLDHRCPGMSKALPLLKILGGLLLKKYAIQCHNSDKEELARVQAASGGRVNFVSDVWQDVSKNHLLGSQLSFFGKLHFRRITG